MAAEAEPADRPGVHHAHDSETIETAIEQMLDAVRVLSDEASHSEFRRFDLEVLAVWFAAVGEANSAIRMLHQILAEAVSAAMTRRQMVVAGISLDWGDHADTVTWDADGLLPMLLRRAREERVIDAETGEIELEGSALLRLIRECVGVSYFRANRREGTGLYAHAIDPDDYRTRTRGPRRARIVMPK